MSAYYNEFDPKTAAWLRELIKDGIVAPGEVDTRSITEVTPNDLKGFDQCHFFAGIGGWSYALRLAGISDSDKWWTASLPCQPFSAAGRQEGAGDDRHLWPCFFRLVCQCGPQRIAGEQVARAIGFNWLDGVSADLEAQGYTVGSIVLGAHSLGAPHRRQRLYWLADTRQQSAGRGDHRPREGALANGSGTPSQLGGSSDAIGMADAKCSERWEGDNGGAANDREASGRDEGSNRTRERSNSGRLADSERPRLEGHTGNERNGNEPGRIGSDETRPASESGSIGLMGDTANGGRREQRNAPRQGSSGHPERTGGPRLGGMGQPHSTGPQPGRQAAEAARHRSSAEPASSDGAWSNFDIIPCRDGKARRIESGTFPLVNGLPRGVVYSSDPSLPIDPKATAEARVMRLKGYGNAIIPELAAEFILAYLHAIR